MSEFGGSQSSRGPGPPRVFFPGRQGLARSLFQMGSLKGISNPGYHPEPARDDVELDIDYNSFADDTEFRENDKRDSGRGSHEESEDKFGTTNSSRISKGALGDQLDEFGYSSDESVGHFRPGFSSSEESLTESNFEDRILPSPEENTLEKSIPFWNVFATAPHINSEESKQLCFALARKIMKVLTYIVMFPCMLGLIILSKRSVLIAVANMRPYPRTFKALAGDNDTSDNSTFYADYGDTYEPENDTTTTDYFIESTTAASLPTDGGYFDLRCRTFADNRTVTLRTHNDSYEGFEIYDYTRCVAVPYGYESAERLDDLSCLNPYNQSGYLNASAAYSRDECFVVRNYWAWSVFLMICTPYIFIFLRCFWRILFKKKKSPSWKAIVATLIIETLHAIGISIMFFVVMPSLDNSIIALMFLLGVSTVPGALKILVRPEDEKRRILKLVLDCLATIGQTSILVIYQLLVVPVRDKNYDSNLIWSIPISLLLVSVRWWENFVEKNSKLGKIRKFLNRVSGQMRRSRTKIQLIANLWKVVVTFVAMMLCMPTQVEYMDPLDMIEKKFTAMFNFSHVL